MLVKVYTDVGEDLPVALYAKVCDKNGSVYVIRYLSPTDERDDGKVIYRYETDEYEITDESIMEYLDGDEEDIGYKVIDDGFVKEDSDSDYESESETTESESESVVESDAEEFFVEDNNE